MISISERFDENIFGQKPVYQIVNNELIFTISDTPKFYTFKAERNIIQANDDWLGIAPEEDYEFLSIKSVQ